MRFERRTRDVLQNSLAARMREEVDTATMDLVEVCESPIEIMLGTAIDIMWRLVGDSYGVGGLGVVRHEDCDGIRSDRVAWLIPQYEHKGARYDFALFHPHLSSPVFIECDGHDFHERTKEQAKRDRSRDRRSQTQGGYVLRFTGSEIWADAAKCAVEVIDFVSRAFMHGRSGR